jgi:hypothetical protein
MNGDLMGILWGFDGIIILFHSIPVYIPLYSSIYLIKKYSIDIP